MHFDAGERTHTLRDLTPILYSQQKIIIDPPRAANFADPKAVASFVVRSNLSRHQDKTEKQGNNEHQGSHF